MGITILKFFKLYTEEHLKPFMSLLVLNIRFQWYNRVEKIKMICIFN